jgi:hypothetical protein
LKKIIFISILFLNSFLVLSQEEEKKLVQLSGLILTADSTLPIPYAHIQIVNTYRGTIASLEGFFSLVVHENDTIEFGSLGFKRKWYVIPENLDESKMSVLIALETDTLVFDETLIYPWPTPAKFKQAFLAADPHKTYYDIAMENLDPKKMKALRAAMRADGAESQQRYMSLKAAQAGYYGGQTNYAQFPGMNTPVPLSLLDPQAWYKFIKALKEGKFKRQDD